MEGKIEAMNGLMLTGETRRRVGDDTQFDFLVNTGKKKAEETVILVNDINHSVEEKEDSKRSRVDKLESTFCTN